MSNTPVETDNKQQESQQVAETVQVRARVPSKAKARFSDVIMTCALASTGDRNER